MNAVGSKLYRTDEDGSEDTYYYDSSKGKYISLPSGGNARNSLSMDAASGQYVWKEGKTGLTEVYEGSGAGRILNSTDSSGNVRTYAYGCLLYTSRCV